MADTDITGATASTTIDGVIFSASGPIGSGSGIYNPVLALKTGDSIETGFSSGATQNTEISQSKTVVIALSSIPIRTIGGVSYYEFRLDLNESNGGDTGFVSLNAFKIYTSTNKNLVPDDGTTLPVSPTTPASPFVAGIPENLIYNIDAGGDQRLFLFDRNSGSGADDYTILVPTSKFGDAILNPANNFVYLYAELGATGTFDGVIGKYAAANGFEEFNSQQSSTISGTKFSDVDGDGVRDQGEVGLAGFTIYVDLNGNNKLDFGEQFAKTDTNGAFTLNSILSGNKINGQNFTTVTYHIREVLTSADIGDGWISPQAALLAATFGPPSGIWDQTTDVEGGVDDGDQLFNVNGPSAYTGLLVGNFKANPALAIDKLFVNVTGGDGDALADAVGDVLNYTVKVTNTGNVTLTGVTMVDPLTGDSIPAFTLAPGAFQTFNTDYVLTQLDLDKLGNAGADGDIDNTATADSNETNAVQDSAEVPLVYAPALAIDKLFVNVTGGDGDALADAVGDVLNYTVKVTNTGNVTLTGVTMVDPLTGDSIPAFTLAPGAFQTFNTDYVLTQLDLDKLGNAGADGDIDNTATADSNETNAVQDSAEVPLVYAPALAIDKLFVNVTGGDGDALADAVGDVLNYTVKVTNTGTVTLTGVTMVDPLTGDSIPAFTLAPGAFQTFNTDYVLTQLDLDKLGNAGADGDIDNTATADSNETNAVQDSAEVPLVYAPALAIDKLFVNVTGGDGDALADAVGDVLNYTVKVTNTGNVTLTGVTMVDPLTGDSIPAFTLAPGAFQTFNTDYVLTQLDLDKLGNAGADGDIDNTATANSNETNAVQDSAEVPLVYAPALAIDKLFVNVTGGDGDALADAVGDVLNYTVKVTNTGNVTLTGVTMVDPLTGDSIPAFTLAPGAFQTFNTDYVLTQLDLDKLGNAGADGDIDNTATADSNETNAVQDSAEVPLVYAPALAIDKLFVNVTGGDGDALADAVGDVLNYTVKVTNTGTVTLTGVTMVDPLTGDSIPAFTLAPGAFQTFNTDYVLTQLDLDKLGNAGADGDIDNTATADSNETNAVQDSAEVPLVYAPALAIDKLFVNVTGGDGDALADAVGDVLNYTVKVTNTGNVTLTGVTMVDPLTGDSIPAFTLAPGAFQTFNTDYVLTQLDLDKLGNAGADGDIDNTATADSNETNAVQDSAEVPLVYAPALAIDKLFVNVTGGDGDALADAVGDVLNYTVKVTNTGNVTLTGVTMVDPLTGDSIPAFTLAPGAFQTFNTDYVLTQLDLDKLGNAGADGDIDNTATADSNETNAVQDSAEVPLVYAPALAIDKLFVNVTGGDGDALADAVGDVLNYTVKVTNTGNVTLTGVTMVDPLTGDSIPAFTLAPGAFQTFNTDYVLTQLDLDKLGNAGADGDIDNTATADSNETNAVQDSAEVPLVYAPALAIDKLFVNVTGGDGDALADAVGDVLNYTVKVTNTGNVTLTGVTMVDPLTGDSIPAFTLAPGAFQTFNTDYVLTQLDLDKLGNAGADGDIDNTATADSNETNAVQDSAEVPLVYNPLIEIQKLVSVDTGAGYIPFDDANSTTGPNANVNAPALFKAIVTNTGNVTLTGVRLSDVQSGPTSHTIYYGSVLPAGAPANSLAVSALVSVDFNGNGSLADAGDITNATWASLDANVPGGDGTFDTIALTPGGKITVTYALPFEAGQHTNTATVTTTQTATDNDPANYYGFVNEDCVGVRTPGFWQNMNNGGQFWDGIANNEKNSGKVGFAEEDLLYAVDPNGPAGGDATVPIVVDSKGVITNGATTAGLLIGDYNRNGITDAGEDTLFISYNDARTLINANEGNGPQSNGVEKLGRDVVATWLNYLANNEGNVGTSYDCLDNPGTGDDAFSPKHYLDDAINWFQQFAGKDADAPGVDTFDVLDLSAKHNMTSTAWLTKIDGTHDGNAMHAALAGYNETGIINNIEFCCDADSQIALAALATIV